MSDVPLRIRITMNNPTERDFFIGYTARTVANGRQIACSLCFEAMDRPRVPFSIVIDRVGGRCICDACSERYAPALTKMLRTWYGPSWDRFWSQPKVSSAPSHLMPMAEYAAECVETVEIVEATPDEIARAAQAPEMNDDDEDDDD